MTANKSAKRWLSDVELVDSLGGALSVAFLRKDRIGAQRIPFHRIGKLARYDLDEVNAAIERSKFGGKAVAEKRAQP